MNKWIILGILISLFLFYFAFNNIVIIDGVICIKRPSKKKFIPEDKFSYNIQYSNFRNSQVEEKGTTDYITLVSEFNKFPWKQELSNPNMQTSPTISVKDHFSGYMLGISAIGTDNKNNIYYHLFYVNDRDIKILKNQTTDQVFSCMKLFFKRDRDSLRKIFNN